MINKSALYNNIANSQQLLYEQPKQFTFQDLHHFIFWINALYAQYHSESNILDDQNNIDLKVKSSEHGFQDPKLVEVHLQQNVLYLDKYVETSVPDQQTITILDSIPEVDEHYHAWFGSGQFWINWCVKKDKTTLEEFKTQYVTPNIKGESYNPYSRFQSSRGSARQQCHKIMDLVGLQTQDLEEYDHPPIILFLTLTFPWEISRRLLFDYEETKKQMWKSYKYFFKQLNKKYDLPDGHKLGCSSSLHTWNSSIPVLPHAHFHTVLPFWSYHHISKDYRLDVEALNSEHYTDLYSLVQKRQITSTNSKDFEKVPGFKDNTVRSKKLDTVTSTIIDEDFEEHSKLIKKRLSESMSPYFEFQPLKYRGQIEYKGQTKKVPLDLEEIKELWKKSLYKYFKEDLPEDLPTSYFNIHVKFINSEDKGKLYHHLSYKSRPAVLDLDLFLRTLHKHIDADKKDFINYEVLTSRIYQMINSFEKKQMDLKADVWRGYLDKLNWIIENCSKQTYFEWIQQLAVSQTDTRGLGWWNNINRYRCESIEKPDLPIPRICPICGGRSQKIIAINNPGVDAVIQNNGSTFHLFKTIPPPT